MADPDAGAHRKPIRKLRHWKQQFEPNAKFVWRRAMRWNKHDFVAGEPVPEWLQEQLGRRLRRFWESNMIELAEFAEPNSLTGLPPDPPPDPPEEQDAVADGEASNSDDKPRKRKRKRRSRHAAEDEE